MFKTKFSYSPQPKTINLQTLLFSYRVNSHVFFKIPVLGKPFLAHGAFKRTFPVMQSHVRHQTVSVCKLLITLRAIVIFYARMFETVRPQIGFGFECSRALMTFKRTFSRVNILMPLQQQPMRK